MARVDAAFRENVRWVISSEWQNLGYSSSSVVILTPLTVEIESAITFAAMVISVSLDEHLDTYAYESTGTM